MAELEERSAALAGEEAVRVFVRIRPLNKRELTENQKFGWAYNDTSMLEETSNGQRAYVYDRCFGEKTNNTIVYDVVGKPIVSKAMEGFNGTVFTYGQTGSGKTWSMRGCPEDPGMMTQCIRDVFDYVAAHPKNEIIVKVSYMEVYNEEINDLLGSGGPDSKNLKILTDDPVKGAIIENLVEEIARSPDEMLSIMKRGETNRSYASTEMNAESSRSHVIYRLMIEVKDEVMPEDADSGGMVLPGSAAAGGSSRVSYLNLVDLAGSERQKSTGASGSTLKEGANINKSLLALGAVINKLGEASKPKPKGAKPVFIPYRDSKLTRILKQSLGGNTLTSMLCAVSPASSWREETVSTLKFGQLCKSIKNSVKSNEIVDDKTLLRQLKAQVADLKSQLEEALGAGGGSHRRRAESSFNADGSDGDGSGTVPIEDYKNLESKVKEMESHLDGKSMSAFLSEIKRTLGDNDRLKREWEDMQSRLEHNERYQEECVQREQDLEERTDQNMKLKQRLDEEKEEISKIKNQQLRLLEEKEARVVHLLGQLDDKESKFRQHLQSIEMSCKEWDNKIQELKERENVVESLRRGFSKQESKLDQMNDDIKRKQEDLRDQERKFAEKEQKLNLFSQQLVEKENFIEDQFKKVDQMEKEIAMKNGMLEGREAQCKLKDTDNELKERELMSKRQEVESLRSLLLMKEQKLSEDIKKSDERDLNLRRAEDAIIQKENSVQSLKEEASIKVEKYQVLFDQYSKKKEELDIQEKKLADDIVRYHESQAKLSEESALLEAKEAVLREREARTADLEQREEQHLSNERQLQQKVDKFHNEVAQITARHAREMARLTELVSNQLGVVKSFEAEVERSQKEISDKKIENDYLVKAVRRKDESILALQKEVQISSELMLECEAKERRLREELNAIKDRIDLDEISIKSRTPDSTPSLKMMTLKSDLDATGDNGLQIENEFDIDRSEQPRSSVVAKPKGRHASKKQETAEAAPPTRDELNDHLRKTQQMLQKIVNSYPSLSPLLAMPEQLLLQKKTNRPTDAVLEAHSSVVESANEVINPSNMYFTGSSDASNTVITSGKVTDTVQFSVLPDRSGENKFLSKSVTTSASASMLMLSSADSIKSAPQGSEEDHASVSSTPTPKSIITSSAQHTLLSFPKPLNYSDLYEHSRVDDVLAQSHNDHERLVTEFQSPVGSYLSNSMQIDPNFLRYSGLFPPPAVVSEIDSCYPTPQIPQISSLQTSTHQSIFGLEKTMNETLQPVGSLEKRKPSRSQPLDNYKSRSKTSSTPLRGGIPVATITLSGVGSAGSKVPKSPSMSEIVNNSRSLQGSKK